MAMFDKFVRSGCLSGAYGCEEPFEPPLSNQPIPLETCKTHTLIQINPKSRLSGDGMALEAALQHKRQQEEKDEDAGAGAAL